MGVTVGIVRSRDVGATPTDVWPVGAGGADEGFSDVILVPPASLEEVARRSSFILLELPADELRAALSSLRADVSPGAAVVSTSPVVSLELIRSLVGPGPALFRAIMSSGTEPPEGVAALAPEPGTPAETIKRVEASLAWRGAVEVVERGYSGCRRRPRSRGRGFHMRGTRGS